MTTSAVFLPSLFLLLLCCHGNWLLAEANHLTQAETNTDHDEGRSRDQRSSCQRQSRFLSCYDAVAVSFPDVLGDTVDSSGRLIEVPIRMTALGRRFDLRLYADDLSGKEDGSRPHRRTWSSVISPSVMGKVLIYGCDL